MAGFKRCVASLRMAAPQRFQNTPPSLAAWWLPAAAGATVLAGVVLKSRDTSQGQPASLRGRLLPEMVVRSDAVGWQRYQRFSFARDDPYKMAVAPDVAPFLQKGLGSAQAQREAVQKFELPVQGLETEKDLFKGALDRTFAWQLENVLTRDQCLELIAMANDKGFVPALANNQGLYEVGDPRKGDENEFDFARRDCYIAMWDAPLFADWLWKVLGPQLKAAPLPDGWRVDHLNSFMRTICYSKEGQAHNPHFDAHFRYPKSKYPEGHEWTEAKSMMSLFVYLSDVPSESGGAIAFPKPLAELTNADMRVQPAPGRVVLFSQNLWHAGAPMKADHGDVKYVIRTDVMCLPTTEPSVDGSRELTQITRCVL